MDNDRRYFLMLPHTKYWVRWQDVKASVTTCRKAWKEAKARYGASHLITFGNERFAGFLFPSNATPAGWRIKKGNGSEDYCVPDKKTKHGRAIALELAAMPKHPTSLAMGFSHWTGGYIYLAGVREFGTNTVLSIHKDTEEQPEGCTELKMSEYWAMREQFEAKEGTTHAR